MNTLILSGGGFRCISSLGALQFCEDEQLLTNIRTFVGTSAGAIIAYLVIIGYKPMDIMSILINHRVFKDQMPSFHIFNAMEGNGGLSFSVFHEILEELTIQKTGTLLTLQQLHDTFSKKLVVAVYNMTKEKTEYLSYETHPDLPCLIALRMSCAIPFLFKSYFYKEEEFIDAGVASNFPVDYEADATDKVLGIYLSTQSEFGVHQDHFHSIIKLLLIPHKELTEYQIEKHRHKFEFLIPLNPRNSLFDYCLTFAEKMEIFVDGYNTARQVFGV